MIVVSSAYVGAARARLQGPRPLLAAIALALPLAGCNGNPADDAIDLYHNLEGGQIAAQRPPPPGVDAPYPKIGTTPTRPLAADIVQQQRIADTLAAQRDAAGAAAARQPLTAPAPSPVPPKPPADPNGNKVVVAAAPAPPPPPPPAPASPQAAPGIDSLPPVPAEASSGPMPAFADAPPPAPAGFGIASPLPPPTRPPEAEPVPALPNGVAVAFTPGSSTLPPSATLRLRRFVLAHRGARVTVLGRGDGRGRDLDGQAGALDLALKRAAAIAASLGAAGVQPGKLTIKADASGLASTATLD